MTDTGGLGGRIRVGARLFGTETDCASRLKDPWKRGQAPRGRPANSADRARERPARGRSGGWAGLAAAAILLLVLGWNLLSTKGDLRTLRAQLTALQADSAQSRAEQAKLEEVIRFLSDPLVRTVKLSGLKPSPRATARLLWKAETRKGYFLTAELPRVPEGKTYALWAIAGKKPVPFA